MTEELDSLAHWFRENVLELHQAGESAFVDENSNLNGAEAENFHAVGDDSTRLKSKKVKAPDDELTLIEYIIGIDDIR